MNLLLRTLDIEVTRTFYREALGFDVQNGPEGTLNVTCGDGDLIFADADNLGTAPVLSGTIYLFVDDVQGLFDSLPSTVDIAWPLQQMDYGTFEFGIQDNNGYLLAFAQRT